MPLKLPIDVVPVPFAAVPPVTVPLTVALRRLMILSFVIVPLPPTTLPMIAFSIVTSLPVAFPFATLV